MEKNKPVFTKLACGCVVQDTSVGMFCKYHIDNQPSEGDALYKFLATRELIKSTEEDTNFVAIDFLNDGRKVMNIRVLPTSHQDNPDQIKPQELKTIKVRPGGFVKLWDYDDSYHLLVD